MKKTSDDSNENTDFENDDPTQPRIHETLAEVSARWEAAKAAGIDPEPGTPEPIVSERVTRNIRRPNATGNRPDLRTEQDWDCGCSSCVNRNKPNNQK